MREKTGLNLDEEVFTIGFARRATGYKRADLILSDLDRLRQIAKKAGHFQIIYAGKAHPNNGGGKDIIRHIFYAKKALRKAVPVVFLDEYNLDLGGKMTSGVDLWLNTPQFPLEASGTSGMKAALNGVPSLSNRTAGGYRGTSRAPPGGRWRAAPPMGPMEPATDNTKEAESLYWKLDNVLLPRFDKETAFIRVNHAARHRHQRFVLQYAAHGPAVHYGRVSEVGTKERRFYVTGKLAN